MNSDDNGGSNNVMPKNNTLLSISGRFWKATVMKVRAEKKLHHI
jgi:hypothetical protein